MTSGQGKRRRNGFRKDPIETPSQAVARLLQTYSRRYVRELAEYSLETAEFTPDARAFWRAVLVQVTTG